MDAETESIFIPQAIKRRSWNCIEKKSLYLLETKTVKFRFSLRKRNDTEMKIKEKIKKKLLENNAASRRRLFF